MNDDGLNNLRELRDALLAGGTVCGGVAEGLARPYAVIPEGAKLEDLTAFLPEPPAIRGRFEAGDLAAFCRYVEEFKGGATLIAANLHDERGRFEAVLDYHRPDKPSWCGHRAVYETVPSPEAREWWARDKRFMAQTEFAEWLEDRLGEIVVPEAAEMLEVVTSLQAQTKATFERSVRLENGNVGLTYREETTARAGQNGRLEVPKGFRLRMPLFRGGEHVEIDARLRYRIKEGALSFAYALERKEEAVRLELEAMCETVHSETGFAPLRGVVPGHHHDGVPF